MNRQDEKRYLTTVFQRYHECREENKRLLEKVREARKAKHVAEQEGAELSKDNDALLKECKSMAQEIVNLREEAEAYKKSQLEYYHALNELRKSTEAQELDKLRAENAELKKELELVTQERDKWAEEHYKYAKLQRGFLAMAGFEMENKEDKD